ncbi:MAG: 1-phosphofructokinase [Clostridia bacterium]|nr:1-phosphofructokinase [Clostridia bacterium]
MILTVTANPAVDRVYFVTDFVMGEVRRPLSMKYTAGGKGLNVARVSKIMGAQVGAMGFVGGYNGEFIKNEIEKLGIKNEFTQIKGETRNCVNISDERGVSGEILEKGPEVSQNEAEAFLESFKENLEKYDIITVSGSLPQGLDSSFYLKLIECAKKMGKRIIVDTSGPTLKDVIKAKPYMVKPNRDELSAYLGRSVESLSDVSDALKILMDEGIEVPMVSLGKDGAMACIEGRIYKFATPCVNAKNTVGSGDSTIAGIVTGLDRGMSVIDAIKLGMASGTANTQFEETGLVSCELVEKYYIEVNVTEW